MGKGSPRAGHHPTVTRSGRMPASTNLLSSASPGRDATHSSSCWISVVAFWGLVFFGFAPPFLGAISQIWLGFGGGSRSRCESRNATVEEEDEMAKGQRYERGVRRRSYKALPHLFAFEGFWETIPMICASLNSLQQQGGPLPGLSCNRGPYCRFLCVICYGSPNIHRLLCQPLRLSNYYCTPITLLFSPRFCFLEVDCCF